MAQDKLFKYLPVSAVDRQWGLFVCTTGTDRVRPGVNYPLPGHPEGYAFSWERGRVLHEYQIVYIIAGKGVFESRQTGLCAVSAGDALILRPGDWHRYRPDEGTGWHEYWVGFSGTYALQLMRQDVFKSGAPVLHPGLRENLIMLFQQLLDVAADDVLVLRNAGPKGAPGMPEAGYLPIPKKLGRAGKAVADNDEICFHSLECFSSVDKTFPFYDARRCYRDIYHISRKPFCSYLERGASTG